MNAIQITGNNPQADGNWKVSYNATYEDSLHIEGFLYVSQDDMNNMMMRDLPDYVSNKIVNKLGNSAPKVDAVESDSTSASVTVD